MREGIKFGVLEIEVGTDYRSSKTATIREGAIELCEDGHRLTARLVIDIKDPDPEPTPGGEETQGAE